MKCIFISDRLEELELFNYSYCKFFGKEYDLISFNNSDELFGYLKLQKKSDPPDVIFIKMDMDLDLNGFQIIVRLRALGIECKCVLLGYFFSFEMHEASYDYNSSFYIHPQTLEDFRLMFSKYLKR